MQLPACVRELDADRPHTLFADSKNLRAAKNTKQKMPGCQLGALGAL